MDRWNKGRGAKRQGSASHLRVTVLTVIGVVVRGYFLWVSASGVLVVRMPSVTAAPSGTETRNRL